jgi:hypothetical protein
MESADSTSGPPATVALDAPFGSDAVEGVGKGPESSEQPEEQPVAAGPTKVGEKVPRLDDVIVLGGGP